MACAACGKKYPGTPPQLTAEQREAARVALEIKRKVAAERSGARVPTRATGAPRGYVSANQKVKAPGGGPGYPEKLLVKGVK